MARLLAPVTPGVLKWAREGLGIPITIAASKLKLEVSELEAYESGADKPSFAKLLAICNLYKRAPGVFFLPNVPPPDAKPQDYRVLEGSDPRSLSASALLEFRRALARRESAIELSSLLGESPIAFVHKATLSSDVANLARTWRVKFGAQAGAWKSEYDALGFWKESVESFGVLVFQPTVDSLDDFRGVAMFFEKFPIIILNSKDSVRGRIFSLLHEFAHLLLNVSAIGNMEPDSSSRSKFNKTEIFCNDFAGSCLFPPSNVKSESLAKVIAESQSATDVIRAIETLVKKYQASWEVIIRRIHEAGLISQAKYNSFRIELRSHYGRAAKKTDSGFAEHLNRRIAANGKRYTGLVLRASAENRIPKAEVSSLLGVKINHLVELKGRLRERSL